MLSGFQIRSCLGPTLGPPALQNAHSADGSLTSGWMCLLRNDLRSPALCLQHSNMYFDMHTCVRCVCGGVVGGVDSWWMVTSPRCVATGTAKGPRSRICALISEKTIATNISPLDSGPNLRWSLLPPGVCVCQRRGYERWLLINLMSQMSRKRVLIINTRWKSVSIVPRL